MPRYSRRLVLGFVWLMLAASEIGRAASQPVVQVLVDDEAIGQGVSLRVKDGCVVLSAAHVISESSIKARDREGHILIQGGKYQVTARVEPVKQLCYPTEDKDSCPPQNDLGVFLVQDANPRWCRQWLSQPRELPEGREAHGQVISRRTSGGEVDVIPVSITRRSRVLSVTPSGGQLFQAGDSGAPVFIGRELVGILNVSELSDPRKAEAADIRSAWPDLAGIFAKPFGRTWFFRAGLSVAMGAILLGVERDRRLSDIDRELGQLPKTTIFDQVAYNERRSELDPDSVKRQRDAAFGVAGGVTLLEVLYFHWRNPEPLGLLERFRLSDRKWYFVVDPSRRTLELRIRF